MYRDECARGERGPGAAPGCAGRAVGRFPRENAAFNTRAARPRRVHRHLTLRPFVGEGPGVKGALHPQRPMRTGRRTAPQNRTRAVAIPGVFFTSLGRRRGVLTEPEAFLKRATYNRLSATSHNREGDCRQPGPTSSRRPQAGDSPPLGSGFDRSPADGISHSAQLWPSRHIRSPCPQTSKI
jgi:hypothetical protein